MQIKPATARMIGYRGTTKALYDPETNIRWGMQYLAMAHQLGIHVVAEGVETQEQHDILLAAGCDYGQGYWYCRPIAAAALSERLRQQQEGALALPTP